MATTSTTSMTTRGGGNRGGGTRMPLHYQLYQTARCLAEQGFNADVVTIPPGKQSGCTSPSTTCAEALPPTPASTATGVTTPGGHSPTSREDNNVRFYKTRICVFHQKGACVKGDQCSYAHDESELKASPNLIKTRLCQDWLNGRCSAENCKFAHGRHELRFTHDYFKTKLCHFWQQGGCTKGDLCRHAHGEGELRPMPPVETMPKPQQHQLPTLSVCSTTVWNDEDMELFSKLEGSHLLTEYGSNAPGMMIPTPGCGMMQQPIPTPSTGLSSQVSSCSDRDAAVIEALRLAEEAQRLVARSTELLAASTTPTTPFLMIPPPASAPPYAPTTSSLSTEASAATTNEDRLRAANSSGILDGSPEYSDIEQLTDVLTKMLLLGDDEAGGAPSSHDIALCCHPTAPIQDPTELFSDQHTPPPTEQAMDEEQEHTPVAVATPSSN